MGLRPFQKKLVEGAIRNEVISALAIEQDDRIQQDEMRIKHMTESSREFQEQFARVKKEWKKKAYPLSKQHEELIKSASFLS